jgi:hypothetical protein
VVDFDAITPRSGLSQYGGAVSSVAAPIISAGEFIDQFGNWSVWAASARTVSTLRASPEPVWSDLSYIGSEPPSGNSRSYWDGDFIYDAGTGENLVVVTNNVDTPKFFTADKDAATYSDYTFLDSFMSKAKSVVAHDNRVVFFNVEADQVRRPHRMVFTPRGLPTSDDLFNGAGVIDEDSMRGIGQKIVRDQEGLLLFTDREIWRARPRRDIFAYDLFALKQIRTTAYPRTIVNTAEGVVFVGIDFEVYLIAGNVVSPLSLIQQGEPSRIKDLLMDELTEPDRAWAVYHPRKNRYELYYNVSGSGFAARALYFDFETRSWLQQRLDSHELSSGVAWPDPDPAPGEEWDQRGDTFDASAEVWNEVGTPQRAALEDADIMTFSSEGTAYRLSSDQTTDDGNAIDARWRSHGMTGRGRLAYERLHEVWTEYDATSASSASVFCSHDLGTTFDDGFALSLQSSSHSVEFAPVGCEARAPQFEFRVVDGGKPRIYSFQAVLVPSGSAFGGGA